MVNGGALLRKKAWESLPGTTVDGPDAAIMAGKADPRAKTLEKGFLQEDEQKFAPAVRAPQVRGLASWSDFDMFRPVVRSTTQKTHVEARRKFTRKDIDGKARVKAR